MTQTMTRKDNMRLHEKQVRVTVAIPLGAALTDMYALPDSLEDFIESYEPRAPQHTPEEFREFFKFAEEYEVDLDDRNQAGDHLSDYVNNRDLYGFLAHASKPVGNSWGHTTVQWFYGPDWPSVLAQVEAWATPD